MGLEDYMVGLVELYNFGPHLSTVTAFFRLILSNEVKDPSRALLNLLKGLEGLGGGCWWMVGLVEIYIFGPLLTAVTAFFRPVLSNAIK